MPRFGSAAVAHFYPLGATASSMTGPFEEEHIIKWLEKDTFVKLTTPNEAFHLGIELQTEGKLIGYLALCFGDVLRLQANFQIYVGRKFQRQGFATEAPTP